LRERYTALVMAHSSVASEAAAGLRGLRDADSTLAATQAAWRFYSNPRVTNTQLAQPLLNCARQAVAQSCERHVLVPLDWARLDYGSHTSKIDRVVLQNRHDLGYKMLTALAVSDRAGYPLAPLCLELKAADGLHSTRLDGVQAVASVLDGLTPVMAQIQALQLERSAVFVIDREADSVKHFRLWHAAGHLFLVRAKSIGGVVCEGVSCSLQKAAASAVLKRVRAVSYLDGEAEQFAGEISVVLERPASSHRTLQGKRHQQQVKGPALSLRLVVSELRDAAGKVLAAWRLLTNLAPEVDAGTVVLWYYWRWRIESYHKLLKSSGQQVEKWLQDDAATLMRRLLVSAMACVLVWQLARDTSAQADKLRQLLVRLSGRQMKRGKDARGFTETALLAGLGVLLPMLQLLEEASLTELRQLTKDVLPFHWMGIKSG